MPFYFVYEPGRTTASQYKKYLQQYYSHNFNGDGVNDLAAYADLCIKMEGELMSLLNQRRHWKLDADEFVLSNEITEHVRQMANVNCYGFPAAAIALQCIAKEARLLCELIENGYVHTETMVTCSWIRRFALRFMTYKGPAAEHVAAAATMMGTMKEADLLLEFLGERHDYDDKGVFLWGATLRNSTVRVMFKLCPECRAAEETAEYDLRDNILFLLRKYLRIIVIWAGMLGNWCLMNLMARIVVRRPTCRKGMRELAEESYLEERKAAKKNTTVETSEKQLLKGGSMKGRSDENDQGTIRRRQPEGKERQEHDQG